MSGIAAIIRFDGKPVEVGEIARLTDAMAYRGPDGITHHIDGSAAIGHCMLRTTAESHFEVQPLTNEDASVVLAFDGYLSHPEELRGKLTESGAVLRDRSDAELILRSYERWGEACPRHIDGEFAFVIWDARKRSAFCAKDVAGMRPLHWHRDPRRLVIASDIAGVVAMGDFALEMNLGMAAEHLASEWHSVDETIWSEITRVPPATAVRFDATGERSERYWEPLPERWRKGSDADLAVEYREMLADCVRRASRTDRTLACDVSGGLDSSAIFALAHRELKEGCLPAPSIDGYSYAFEAGRPEDELAYAQAVAEWVGTETTPVPPFLPDLDWFADRAAADFDLAPYPNAAMAVSIGQRLVERGSRVSLNGEGGDNWLTGQPFYYSEHIDDRDWGALGRSLSVDAKAFGPREAVRRLWRHGLAPMAPPFIRRLRRQRRDRDLRGWHGEPYWWLTDEMQDELRARRQAAFERAEPWRRNSLSYWYLRGVLEDPFTAYANDYAARQAARCGYERRAPMNSRTFIEFAFSVGSNQRMRGRQTKAIHVRGMEGTLPDRVLHRVDKIDCALPFERVLDKITSHGVSLLPQRSMELVVNDGIDMLCRRYADSSANFRPRYELWALYNLGLLLGLPSVATRRNRNASDGD